MSDGLKIPSHVAVLGGSSDIALAAVTELVRRHPHKIGVSLCGRDLEKLKHASFELIGAGARFVHPFTFDTRFDDPEQVLTNAELIGGELDLVLVAFGQLGDPQSFMVPASTAELLELNGVQGARALLAGVRVLEGRDAQVVAFSSIAAVRVRGNNPGYEASKQVFDAVACELHRRREQHNVAVLVARLGFVHTKMTDGLSPAPFNLEVKKAASLLADEILAHRGGVTYIPKPLRLVASLIKVLPQPLLEKLG